MNFNQWVEKIKNKEALAFSRFGDGEWLNIQKASGQNCDGNIYYHDLGDKLEEIVSEKQDYHLGVQRLVPFSVEQSSKYEQDWCDSDVFHKASMEGKLDSLFDVLNETHIVYIGNNSLSKLEFIDEFIEIPYNNVWLDYDSILSEIKNKINDDFKLFLFSAGMCANVFIHDMWQFNKDNAYIDIGSIFDPYVGRNSRSYHKNLNIEETD